MYYPVPGGAIYGMAVGPDGDLWLTQCGGITRMYQPALLFALKHKFFAAVIVLVAAVATIPVYRRLGAELLPPLDEGVLLYMPLELRSATPELELLRISCLFCSYRFTKSIPPSVVAMGEPAWVWQFRNGWSS
jgi:hypothetical protein